VSHQFWGRKERKRTRRYLRGTFMWWCWWWWWCWEWTSWNNEIETLKRRFLAIQLLMFKLNAKVQVECIVNVASSIHMDATSHFLTA